MSYQPVSGIVPQYSTDDNELASGYYLKFYIANTTTPLSMATDSTGGTLLVKAKLNPDGLPISNPLDNDTVFIPHVNQNYRLVIYRNEADADANNTAGAFLNVPSVKPMASGSLSGGTLPYVYDSVAEMVAASELSVGSYVRTSGYTTSGDGGGNDYEIVAGGTGTADGGSFIDLDNGLQAKGLFPGEINIRQFGVQDNVPNESGFRAAFKFSSNFMAIPGGRHIYSGTTPITEFQSNNLRLYRASNTNGYDSTIEIQNDTYLFERGTELVQDVYLNEINFLNGKGAYRHNRSDGNAADAVKTRVEGCKFEGYTECAFSTESNDYPYQSFVGNKFIGDELFPTIGISFNGLTDSLRIENNNFLNNAYHLRLPSWSSSANVEGNTFSSRSNNKEADIWILPINDPARTESGPCLNINKNKFGSEFQPVDVPRILIANSSGLASNVDVPDLLNSANTVYGLIINENRYGAPSAWASSIVLCYIEELIASNIDDNVIQSGLENIRYILEFDTIPKNYQQSRNSISGTKTGNGSFYSMPVSNGIDRFDSSLFNWGTGFAPEIKSETGYINVYRQYDTGSITGGSVTITPIANPDFGTNTGSLVTYGASGQEWLNGPGPFPSAAQIKANEGSYLILEMDVEKADTDPLDKIEVTIKDLKQDQRILFQTMQVPENYTRVQAVVKIPPIIDVDPNYRMIIKAVDFSVSSNAFKLYNIDMYIANSPANTKHLRTVDSRWDTPHLVLGSYHLWVDSTGDLRIKSSVPVSDADGTVVGTQT